MEARVCDSLMLDISQAPPHLPSMLIASVTQKRGEQPSLMCCSLHLHSMVMQILCTRNSFLTSTASCPFQSISSEVLAGSLRLRVAENGRYTRHLLFASQLSFLFSVSHMVELFTICQQTVLSSGFCLDLTLAIDQRVEGGWDYSFLVESLHASCMLC